MRRLNVRPQERIHVRLVSGSYQRPGHPWARPAAQVAVCAQEQNNDYFWKLHDFVFEHQREFTPENVQAKLTDEAKRYPKFDRKRFAGCLADKKIDEKIDRDVAFGS